MAAQFTVEQGSQLLSDWIYKHPDELKAKKEALEHYGQYFAPLNLHKLTAAGVRDFLVFKNNRHWGHIQRHPEIYEDVGHLQACLKLLLDEDIPVENRLDQIIPKHGSPYIKGLNRSVITPILMCVYPEKYAVWNRRSDAGLTYLDLNRASSKDSFGKRYVAINDACRELSGTIH